MEENKKLFVGGLPWAATQQELEEAFSQAGTVEEAVIITDKFSGRSKGFGFVTMSSVEEAQKAKEMWDGKDFGGRSIAVNQAQPKREE